MEEKVFLVLSLCFIEKKPCNWQRLEPMTSEYEACALPLRNNRCQGLATYCIELLTPIVGLGKSPSTNVDED